MFDIPEQDQIADKIDILEELLRQHDLQRKAIVMKINFLQAVCIHPQKGRGSATGEFYTYCEVCGKEW